MSATPCPRVPTGARPSSCGRRLRTPSLALVSAAVLYPLVEWHFFLECDNIPFLSDMQIYGQSSAWALSLSLGVACVLGSARARDPWQSLCGVGYATICFVPWTVNIHMFIAHLTGVAVLVAGFFFSRAFRVRMPRLWQAAFLLVGGVLLGAFVGCNEAAVSSAEYKRARMERLIFHAAICQPRVPDPPACSVSQAAEWLLVLWISWACTLNATAGRKARDRSVSVGDDELCVADRRDRVQAPSVEMSRFWCKRDDSDRPVVAPLLSF